MTVGKCHGAAGTGELQLIERIMNANMYLDITEAEHDPLPWETGPHGSIPTWYRPQTHLQENHRLAKETEDKGDGLAKHVSKPKPYWASMEQTEGGEAQGL